MVRCCEEQSNCCEICNWGEGLVELDAGTKDVAADDNAVFLASAALDFPDIAKGDRTKALNSAELIFGDRFTEGAILGVAVDFAFDGPDPVGGIITGNGLAV